MTTYYKYGCTITNQTYTIKFNPDPNHNPIYTTKSYTKDEPL